MIVLYVCEKLLQKCTVRDHKYLQVCDISIFTDKENRDFRQVVVRQVSANPKKTKIYNINIFNVF